jgi:[acyl-carrier-protein] S-malonyltransferase
MTITSHHHAAAWVDHEPVGEAEVDAEIARLRSGPRAALLAVAGSAEGRQLRRWVTQTLVTTRLLEQEAVRVGPLRATSLADVAPDRMTALQLGGVVASVLAQSAAARAVFAHVTSGCSVLPDQVEAYHRRNPDQFTDAHGVEQPLDAVAASITSMLLAAARRRYFIDWLSRRSAVSIQLEPGYEHPGDPRQPDATHRH